MKKILAMIVFVVLTISVVGCGVTEPEAQQEPEVIIVTATPHPPDVPATLAALLEAQAKKDEAILATVAAMQVPEAPEIPAITNEKMGGQSGDGFNFQLIPVSQDSGFYIEGVPSTAKSVLVSECPDPYGNCFKNTVGLGTEMIFAEPGTLLVGPDFDPKLVSESGGHIDWISPITQQMLGTETFSTNTAEGAFTWATGAKMQVDVGDYTIIVDSTGKSCTNNWFVVIRGLFADGKQDSDKNTTTKFSNYISGHTQVMWYPEGAFISEGNFLQVAELSHKGGRNCGAEGTSGLSVLMLDLNTGGFAVVYQANLNMPWQFIAKNWVQ